MLTETNFASVGFSQGLGRLNGLERPGIVCVKAASYGRYHSLLASRPGFSVAKGEVTQRAEEKSDDT
jgi:hypothetical protein